jgi:hypothetical protein
MEEKCLKFVSLPETINLIEKVRSQAKKTAKII